MNRDFSKLLNDEGEQNARLAVIVEAMVASQQFLRTANTDEWGQVLRSACRELRDEETSSGEVLDETFLAPAELVCC